MDVTIMTDDETVKMFLKNNAFAANRMAITCFRCGEQGHYKSECFHWKTCLCTKTSCNDVCCPYAHSRTELRTPCQARCVRVIKREGKLVILGCRKAGHTYKYCPHGQKE